MLFNSHTLHPTSALAAYQTAFAQTLRRRTHNAYMLNSTRSQLYKKLIHTNIFSFIEACFPVCRSIISPTLWQKLCADFMREHECQSPLFHHIPLEFLTWLQNQDRFRDPAEPAFLTHLAHYEYVELHIQTAPNLISNPGVPNSAVLITPIQLVCYPYPVHNIGSTFTQVPLETTWLLIWRKKDGGAGFAQLSPGIYGLADQLHCTQDLATLFLRWCEATTPTPDTAQFVQALRDLADLGILTINNSN